MIEGRRVLGLALSALLGMACADAEGGEPIEVGVVGAALSPCGEMVPENRFIDGIPAYAQCPDSEQAAIYSNNGVDTATSSQGAGWVRTQWSGGYQCTELAHRYLHFKWNVKWIPNGNAGQWCDTQPPANSGLVQTMAPVHGDLMVLAGGSCGAAQSTGHVTVVDTVDMASGKLSVVEQNRARRGSYMVSCAKCFLHVVANDGTNAGAPIAPGTPQPAAGAMAPTTPAGGAAAPSPPSGAGGAAGSARRPAPAGSPAIEPTPPPAAMPPATMPPMAAGPAGSTAPAPVAGAAPSAAGASAIPSGPTNGEPMSEREGAEEGGCSVRGGVAASQPSAAGAGLALLALGLLWMRRRARE